jgi:hypothetical protein
MHTPNTAADSCLPPKLHLTATPRMEPLATAASVAGVRARDAE